jgi:predicted site-specific integrase-resolvase
VYKGWAEPDAEHDWLTSVQAAELLDVSSVAVNRRCRRGRLPFVEQAGRRWFRRDHLELVKRADLVKVRVLERRASKRAAPPPA